jgi:hypothetical protein
MSSFGASTAITAPSTGSSPGFFRICAGPTLSKGRFGTTGDQRCSRGRG